MFAVHDSNKERIYGPFNTKEEAEEWLAKQGIYVGQYEMQEVSILPLYATSEKLEDIATTS